PFTWLHMSAEAEMYLKRMVDPHPSSDPALQPSLAERIAAQGNGESSLAWIASELAQQSKQFQLVLQMQQTLHAKLEMQERRLTDLEVGHRAMSMPHQAHSHAQQTAGTQNVAHCPASAGQSPAQQYVQRQQILMQLQEQLQLTKQLMPEATHQAQAHLLQAQQTAQQQVLKSPLLNQQSTSNQPLMHNQQLQSVAGMQAMQHSQHSINAMQLAGKSSSQPGTPQPHNSPMAGMQFSVLQQQLQQLQQQQLHLVQQQHHLQSCGPSPPPPTSLQKAQGMFNPSSMPNSSMVMRVGNIGFNRRGSASMGIPGAVPRVEVSAKRERRETDQLPEDARSPKVQQSPKARVVPGRSTGDKLSTGVDPTSTESSTASIHNSPSTASNRMEDDVEAAASKKDVPNDMENLELLAKLSTSEKKGSPGNAPCSVRQQNQNELSTSDQKGQMTSDDDFSDPDRQVVPVASVFAGLIHPLTISCA
ncbi:MAG: hypothetical protein SGPRY_006495, partial [Prymnesium sp.]